MDIKTISVAFVAIMVGAVAFVAMLPIFQDVTATEDTFTNEGYFYVESPGEDSITYLFQDGVFKINGETVALPTGSQYPDGLTILYTEHICIRYDDSLMKVRGVANHNAYYLNITVSNGTITGYYEWDPSNPNATISWTYTEFTGMAPSTTDRVMCKSEPQYMNGDSVIDTTGLSRFVNITGYYVIHINGSIDDGVTVHIYNQGSGAEITTITVSNISVNATAVSSHEDLYKLESVTFTVTDENDKSDNVTYTIYTIPAEITAERAIQPDTSFSTIVDLIPLVIGMGLLLIAVWWFVVRKF